MPSNQPTPPAREPGTAGDQSTFPMGTWGGQHISLEATAEGATIDYDCAHGTITEKIVPDRDGKFVVKGFHATERPGPTREGDDQRGQPATYSGQTDGKTLTLTVKLTSSNEEVGTFNLTHGRYGRVMKCK